MKTLYFILAAVCGLLALRLILYRPQGARHRPQASRLAYVLIVLSGAVAISVAYGQYEWALAALIGLVGIVCAGAFAMDGNVSHLLRVYQGRNDHDHSASR